VQKKNVGGSICHAKRRAAFDMQQFLAVSDVEKCEMHLTYSKEKRDAFFDMQKYLAVSDVGNLGLHVKCRNVSCI
jgi:hypothetical protein